MTVGLIVLAQCAALAQWQYEYTQLTYTNGCPLSDSVTTDSAAINCTRTDNLGLTLTFKHEAPTTNACVFTFKGSVDGINYGTIGQHIITLAATGTTPVIYTTNIAVGAVGYIKLDSIVNGATEAMTNIAVYYSTKPRIRGSRN